MAHKRKPSAPVGDKKQRDIGKYWLLTLEVLQSIVKLAFLKSLQVYPSWMSMILQSYRQ